MLSHSGAAASQEINGIDGTPVSEHVSAAALGVDAELEAPAGWPQIGKKKKNEAGSDVKREQAHSRLSEVFQEADVM